MPCRLVASGYVVSQREFENALYDVTQNPDHATALSTYIIKEHKLTFVQDWQRRVIQHLKHQDVYATHMKGYNEAELLQYALLWPASWKKTQPCARIWCFFGICNCGDPLREQR
jgi:hypothetical protein